MIFICIKFSDRKGNSLFAEVDDQRQVMKHLLASQKKSYLEMKKIFNESKFEIHRLKRENIAMHTELQACSTIFCSADKTYQSNVVSGYPWKSLTKTFLSLQISSTNASAI